MFKKRIASLIAVILVLSGLVFAALNAQLIRDTILYYQYEPDETMLSFVGHTGMNERGKFLFFASHPSLEEAESFNQICLNTEQAAAILGCYKDEKIYIYNITNPRLEGIRPTTAAHEMLHAAYGRLGSDDRSRVDALLEAEYAKLKDNNELTSRMKFYEKAQPGDRGNELHSIIGTEVAPINAELEEYYGRYFSDRSKVVAQHHKYHSVFEELRLRSEALSRQIDRLESEIQEKRAEYNAEANQLQRDIQDFNARADSGGFSSQAQFSAERQVLVARASSLEGMRAGINNTIARYNDLVEELNSIAVETNKLNRSIDSSLAPAPSL